MSDANRSLKIGKGGEPMSDDRDKGGSWYLARDNGGTFVDRVEGPKLMAVADYANLGIDIANGTDRRTRFVRWLLKLNERYPAAGVTQGDSGGAASDGEAER